MPPPATVSCRARASLIYGHMIMWYTHIWSYDHELCPYMVIRPPGVGLWHPCVLQSSGIFKRRCLCSRLPILRAFRSLGDQCAGWKKGAGRDAGRGAGGVVQRCLFCPSLFHLRQLPDRGLPFRPLHSRNLHIPTVLSSSLCSRVQCSQPPAFKAFQALPPCGVRGARGHAASLQKPSQKPSLWSCPDTHAVLSSK